MQPQHQGLADILVYKLLRILSDLLPHPAKDFTFENPLLHLAGCTVHFYSMDAYL